MLKKFITPIIYTLFFFPVIIGCLIIIGFIENHFGFIFDMAGYIESPIILLIYGGLIFGIANALMIVIEKPRESFFLVHFRQSSLYYILLIVSLSYFIALDDHGGMRGSMIAVVFFISLFAIVLNALIITIYSRKLKSKEKQQLQNN